MTAAQDGFATALVAERPDDMVHHSSVAKNAATDVWTLHCASLRRINWPIYFVDDAETVYGRPKPNFFSLYTPPESVASFDDHMHKAVVLKEMLPYRVFLDAVVSFQLPLNPRDERCERTAASLPSTLEDAEKQSLVQRGALTSALIFNMTVQDPALRPEIEEFDHIFPGGIDDRIADLRAQYEEWRERGLRPYSLSQLQGYAESGMRHLLQIAP